MTSHAVQSALNSFFLQILQLSIVLNLQVVSPKLSAASRGIPKINIWKKKKGGKDGFDFQLDFWQKVPH